MPVAPTIARRLLWSLAALGSLVLGAGVLFGLMVFYEATSTSAFGSSLPLHVLALAVTLPVFAFGSCLGMAVVPRGVAERQRSRDFGVAMGLAWLGLLLVLPTPLICFSAPLGALAVAVSVALFLRLRRISKGEGAAT